MEHVFPVSPALAGRLFTNSTWEALNAGQEPLNQFHNQLINCDLQLKKQVISSALINTLLDKEYTKIFLCIK